ncbi:MAG: hypothetical protein OEQ81_04025 [Flavobacteriaceae bacterium]|nr:hypothetical protein [Flavobacteriaceae bacterium]
MNAKTTNLIGIVIAILAGTYFFLMYCDACQSCDTSDDTVEAVSSLD